MGVGVSRRRFNGTAGLDRKISRSFKEGNKLLHQFFMIKFWFIFEKFYLSAYLSFKVNLKLLIGRSALSTPSRKALLRVTEGFAFFLSRNAGLLRRMLAFRWFHKFLFVLKLKKNDSSKINESELQTWEWKPAGFFSFFGLMTNNKLSGTATNIESCKSWGVGWTSRLTSPSRRTRFSMGKKKKEAFNTNNNLKSISKPRRRHWWCDLETTVWHRHCRDVCDERA